MPLSISRRVAGITPSATLAIDARAKALKAEGQHIIGFAAGEPDFPTPDYICKAAHEAIDQGKTRYTPASGILELKQAVCDKFLADNQLAYDPAQIIVSTGAKQSLLNALLAVVDPGDEVLLPTPCWLSYPEMIRMAGGIPMYIETTQDANFLPTIEALKKNLSPRTKAILINSPSNPTGCVYDATLLGAIAEFAVANELYVISDEIYEKLVYDGAAHVSIASLDDAIKRQTIVVNGVSKTYAMTGWRIGYAAGPLDVVKGMTAYQSHATSNPNTVAQYAALAALRGGDAAVQVMHAAFDERRRYLVERIRAIAPLACATPQGAFYVMVDCSALLGRSYNNTVIDSTLTLASQLLDHAKVAVVPGEPFNAPGFCRLSYAVSMDDIRCGVDAIEAFVKALA